MEGVKSTAFNQIMAGEAEAALAGQNSARLPGPYQ